MDEGEKEMEEEELFLLGPHSHWPQADWLEREEEWESSLDLECLALLPLLPSEQLQHSLESQS